MGIKHLTPNDTEQALVAAPLASNWEDTNFGAIYVCAVAN